MLNEIKLELEKYPSQISKSIWSIIKDLQKIDGFEVYSVDEWKSNLPTLLPTIGSRMEGDIKTHIEGIKVLLQDQKLRKRWSSLEYRPEDDKKNPL